MSKVQGYNKSLDSTTLRVFYRNRDRYELAWNNASSRFEVYRNGEYLQDLVNVDHLGDYKFSDSFLLNGDNVAIYYDESDDSFSYAGNVNIAKVLAGEIDFPNLSIATIDTSGNKSAVTKEWVLANSAKTDDIARINYTFSSSTTEGDPGSDTFRFNAGKTELYISFTESQSNNIKNILTKAKDTILKVQSGNGKYLNINIKSDLTDNTDWGKLTIEVDNQGIALEDGDKCGLLFIGGGGSSSSSNFQAVINSISDLDTAISGVVTGDWLIESDLTLDANKTIPISVTLHFRNKAKITLGAFDLIGSNTQIVNDNLSQLFDYNSTGVLSGTWDILKAFPQWWGAKGDDSTDDSTAFQAWANFLKQTLGTIWGYIPGNKTYRINLPVDLPKSLVGGNLYITGYNATLKTTSQTTIFQRHVVDQTEALNIISEKYHIEGIRFEGPFYGVDPALETFRALSLEALYSPSIVNCEFSSFDTCLDLKFCLAAQVVNPKFDQYINGVKIRPGAGVWTGAALSTSASNRVRITTPRFLNHQSATSRCSVEINAASGVVISEPIVEGGNPEYGFIFEAQSSTTVKDFRIEGTTHLECAPSVSFFEIRNLIGGLFDMGSMYNQFAATILKQGVGALNNSIKYRQVWNQIGNNYSVGTATVELSGDFPSDIITNISYWNGDFPTNLFKGIPKISESNSFTTITSPNGEIRNTGNTVKVAWSTNSLDLNGGAGGVGLTGKLRFAVEANTDVGTKTHRKSVFDIAGNFLGYIHLYDS